MANNSEERVRGEMIQNIRIWINRELAGYITECGSEYRSYLIEDVVSDISSKSGRPDLKEEIADIARSILNGDL